MTITASPSASAVRFGAYLIAQGRMNAAQLSEALDQQKRRPFLHLGEVLCLMGVIDERELPALMQAHQRESRLGEALLASGAITMAQLADALAHQSEEGAPLGETLVSLGYMARPALESVLHARGMVEGRDVFDKIGRDRQVAFFRAAEAAGRYPFFQPIGGAEGPVAPLYGRETIMLASNSYLGLSDDPEVIAASVEAVRRYGVGTSGSPMLNGTMDLHVALERELCEFVGKPACALFSTGFQTNLGVISAITGRGDVVLVDALAHASIHDGARLGFAEVRRFEHNDLEDLERLLVGARGRGVLIVVDGVYSMDGDLAELPGIVSLARRYGARVLVDDAHGFGVLGRHGRGTAEYFGLLEEVDLLMLTFSKALGTIGGCVLGPREVIHFLKHRSRPFIFAATLPPGTVAATRASLKRLRTDPSLRHCLESNVKFMRRALIERGFSIGPSQTHILPVVIGDEQIALRLGSELIPEGVLVGTVVPPGVPSGQARLRLSLMASHTITQLERALDAIVRVAARLGVPAPGATAPALTRGGPSSMLQHEIRRTDQGVVLALAGDLDTAASQELDAQSESFVAVTDTELTIDLANLNYLNSTGLRSFIRLDKLLKAAGKRLAFHAVPFRIARIFKYCGLDAYFRIEQASEPAVDTMIRAVPQAPVEQGS